MPELTHAQLLAAWLEGSLSKEQQNAFEQACLEDADFAARVETANLAALDATHYEPVAVPKWDRSSTFRTSNDKPWWYWQGLPGLSFATSMLAVVMVVSGFEVTVADGSMTFSFGGRGSQQIVQQLVEERMQNFTDNQQALLTGYTQAMQEQQMENNTKLTNYLLSSSRQERREDFVELIKFINQQRSDDQLFYARQLNKLQDEVYSLPAPQGYDSPFVDSINQ